jgi:hypothetical protein
MPTRKRNVSAPKLQLKLTESEFRYLSTVMQMYVDSVKSYTQMATGALLLPIVFLRQVMGLKDSEAVSFLPTPLWAAWILLLLSIGAGLLYQVRAARYLETEMEEEQESERDQEREGTPQKRETEQGEERMTALQAIIQENPGYVFDFMIVAFYIGMTFLVIGAVEARFPHPVIALALCTLSVLLTAVV